MSMLERINPISLGAPVPGTSSRRRRQLAPVCYQLVDATPLYSIDDNINVHFIFIYNTYSPSGYLRALKQAFSEQFSNLSHSSLA